jgi:hypothetical protein
MRDSKKKTNRENKTFSADYAPFRRIITIRHIGLVGWVNFNPTKSKITPQSQMKNVLGFTGYWNSLKFFHKS